MGVVSRKWVLVESMGVASVNGCKELYIFPNNTYPYFSFFCSSIPNFLFFFVFCC